MLCRGAVRLTTLSSVQDRSSRRCTAAPSHLIWSSHAAPVPPRPRRRRSPHRRGPTRGRHDEHPGGSPANVALTLGRLGRETRLAAHLGQDAHGETLRAWLADSGVTLTPGSDGAAATSVARAVLDASGAATYDFAITWDVAPGTEADDATIAVHTGSIAAVLEPGASAVHDLVLAARERSTITYDPNARPSLMGTAEAALARAQARSSRPPTSSRSATRTSSGSTPAPTRSRSPGPGPREGPRSWS